MQAADVRDADPYGIDLLLAKVERNPEDVWPVGILAQIYFDTGDFVNARKWYARQVEMGGCGRGDLLRDVADRGVDGASR